MMRRSYLKIEYLNDTRCPMISFCRSLLAPRMCEMYFSKFHIKMCYIIYLENDYYYYFYYLKTHANSSPTVFYIAVGHIDLLLKI